MRLDHCDLEAISEGVRELYAVTELERLPPAIIALLGRLISGDGISYNEYQPAKGRVVALIEPQLTNIEEMLPVLAAHFDEHPVVCHFHGTRSLLPFKISDFCTNQQFKRTGLYNEFYRGFEVEHQIAFFLSGSRQHEICLAINRKRRDFSERDRQILTLLRPHLTQALANAAAVSELRETSGYLEQAVESCKQGMAWVDRNGKVLFVTDRAQSWIAEYFAPILSGAILPEDLKNWIKLQLDCVGVVREPLVVSKGDKLLRIRLVEEDPQLLLVLTETCQTVTASRFTSHGLTPREGEVLRWMAEGKSNPEIAKILGASPRTIDKHVERVLAKLNVETRKAAMLRAWDIQRV